MLAFTFTLQDSHSFFNPLSKKAKLQGNVIFHHGQRRLGHPRRERADLSHIWASQRFSWRFPISRGGFRRRSEPRLCEVSLTITFGCIVFELVAWERPGIVTLSTTYCWLLSLPIPIPACGFGYAFPPPPCARCAERSAGRSGFDPLTIFGAVAMSLWDALNDENTVRSA